jgi:hypothetical protein
MANLVGTLGTVPALTVGGQFFTDLTNLITLYGFANGAAPVWTTLRKPYGSAGYQVTAGKTLNLQAAIINTRVAQATIWSTIGYATADGGVNQISAPAGAVEMIGRDGNDISQFSHEAVGVVQYGFGSLPIPATMYPFCVDSLAATTVKATICVMGYEV